MPGAGPLSIYDLQMITTDGVVAQLLIQQFFNIPVDLML